VSGIQAGLGIESTVTVNAQSQGTAAFHAAGAIFTRPTFFTPRDVGGEAGPEALLPISLLSGMMADSLNKMQIRQPQAITNNNSTPIIININGNIRSEADAKAMAILLDRQIIARQRGQGVVTA
jgi:phage-related minor tail protein